MKTNAAAQKLIRTSEGLRLQAYLDPVGIWTIGYGHTSAAGPPHVMRNMRLSAWECAKILSNDLGKYEAAVDRLVTVPLSENQFGALVSLCYNIGPGAFSRSTVRKRLNERNYAGAADAFGMWVRGTVKGKSVVLPGLVKRRADEAKLFRSRTITVTSPQSSARPGWVRCNRSNQGDDT